MTSELYGSEMSTEEAERFLERTGVGTLAFGDEDGGYAVPMSFGYDAANGRCVFQFAFGDGSRKQEYIEKGGRVTLSVYERTDTEDWRTVLVEGGLEEIPPEEETRASAVFASQARMASNEVFRQPVEETEFVWYALDADEVSGRQSVSGPVGDRLI